MEEKQLKCIMAAILYAGMMAHSGGKIMPSKTAEEVAKMADDVFNAVNKLYQDRLPPPDIFSHHKSK